MSDDGLGLGAPEVCVSVQLLAQHLSQAPVLLRATDDQKAASIDICYIRHWELGIMSATCIFAEAEAESWRSRRGQDRQPVSFVFL